MRKLSPEQRNLLLSNCLYISKSFIHHMNYFWTQILLGKNEKLISMSQ
jgi:hypothetical protein